jgi:hypothetical protein
VRHGVTGAKDVSQRRQQLGGAGIQISWRGSQNLPPEPREPHISTSVLLKGLR